MPVIKAAPCWTRFVEFNTSIAGTAVLLRGMAELNCVDLRDNPKLRADLDQRCRAALMGTRSGVNGGLGALGDGTTAPLRYALEPVDTWQAYSVMAEAFPGQTIVADCDCLSPLWAAWFFEVCGIPRVGIGISQPKVRSCCDGPNCTPRQRRKLCGHGMAHAFTCVGGVDEVNSRTGRPYVTPGLRKLLVPYAGRGDVMVFDGSVMAGMPRPKDSFYGSGESAVRWLRDEE